MANIIIGDTYKIRVAITDADGAVVDISGDTLWFTLKLNEDDDDPGVLQHSATLPTTTDTQAGIGVMLVPPSKTSLLTAKQRYYSDVQWVSPDSPEAEVHTVQKKRIRAVLDITKST